MKKITLKLESNKNSEEGDVESLV